MMTLKEAKERLLGIRMELEACENQIEYVRNPSQLKDLNSKARRLVCERIKYETIVERLEKDEKRSSSPS